MKRRYQLQPYQDRGGRAWRWRFVCVNNGEIMASSAEGDGYPTRSGAIRAARRLRVIAGEAEIVK